LNKSKQTICGTRFLRNESGIKEKTLMCDPTKLAHEKKQYLKEWLEKAKSVQTAIPTVQQQLELASWEEEALSNASNQGVTIPGAVTSFLQQDLEIMRQTLPQIPEINHFNLDVSSATMSTTSNVLYQVTTKSRNNINFQSHQWGISYSEKYEIIQSQLGREQQVRTLLFNLKENLASEFEEAVSVYRGALATTASQTNVGIAMRNVMEHYKGEMMNLAREHPCDFKINISLCP